MTFETLPAATWRRRAALGLGMAALAGVFAVGCGSNGAGPATSTSSTTTTTTTTTTPTTTAAATGGGSSNGGGGGGGGGHHHEGGDQQQAPATDTVTQTETATATATQTETQTQTSTQTVEQQPGWHDQQRSNQHNQYGGPNQQPNQNGGH